MKTQIIQLNPNDDAVSVRDKMSWCQTGRILLVWPAHGKVLERQLDLILMQRYAARLGSELALATHDSQVRFHAQQLGIPVFNDARQAQEQDWQVSRKKTTEIYKRRGYNELELKRKSIPVPGSTWVKNPASKILCVGFSLLALVALAIFILPGAKVTVSPNEEMQSITLNLAADPSATTINLSTGSLPTYSQEVIVDGTDWITATGTVTIPVKAALVMLEFTNNSKEDITLTTGIIVTTLGSDRVRFRTTPKEDIVIKPKKPALIEARAIKPGTSGNLPAGSLDAIEGELGLELTVTNPEASSGGLDALVPAPTEHDLQLLRRRLNDSLMREGLDKLRLTAPGDDTLVQPLAMVSEVVEESYSPDVGEPGERLELSLLLRIEAPLVSGEVIRSMVTPILDADVPAGYRPVVNTLMINPLTQPLLGQDGNASWEVEAKRKLLADIPADKAMKTIRGISPSDAVDRLSATIPLAHQAQILLVPSWWPRLPFLAMRITLVEEVTR